MPIVSLRDSDPSGELRSTQQPTSKSEDALTLLQALLGAGKKYQKSRQDKTFRTAAAEALKAGQSDVSYEYDQTTGQYKTKIEPKKQPTQAEIISRFKTGQQFGVDPVTSQQLPSEQLKDPRFGYSGDIFSQLFGQALDSESVAGEDSGPIVAAPQKKKGFSFIPDAQAATPKIDIPTGPGGANPTFLSPLELEAQTAIAQGADPVKVKARLTELMAQQRGKSGRV